MKKSIFFVLVLLLSLSAFAQDQSPLICTNFVKIPNSIIDPMKLTSDQREDLDGNKVARIKIKAHNFDPALMYNFVVKSNGPWITHKTFEGDEMWIYLSSNITGSVGIKYLGNFEYTLPYKLEPGVTYEMTLELQTGTLIIRVTPSDAKILVDDKEVGIGEVNMQVAAAIEHNYRIENGFYYPKTGTVTIAKTDTKNLEINLEPAYGYVKVTSSPVSGAKVFIDGVEAGTTPFLSNKIVRGDHKIEVKKELYSTYSDIVTLDDGKKEEVNATLEANFATISVSTASDAQIWVNNDYKGIGNWSGVVAAGLCTVEARKDGYTPVVNTFILNINESKTLALNAPTYISQESVSQKTEPTQVSDDDLKETETTTTDAEYQISLEDYYDIYKPKAKVRGTIVYDAKSPTKLSLNGKYIEKSELKDIFYDSELKDYKKAIKDAKFRGAWALHILFGGCAVLGGACIKEAPFLGTVCCLFGTGMEILCISAHIRTVKEGPEKNLNDFLNKYNSRYDVSLSVVPAPNGVGLRLNF